MQSATVTRQVIKDMVRQIIRALMFWTRIFSRQWQRFGVGSDGKLFHTPNIQSRAERKWSTGLQLLRGI